MKSYILFFLLISTSGFSEERADTCKNNDQFSFYSSLIQFYERPKETDCNMSGKCPDGSTSFQQPDSQGIGGWEGKCGQTAASNILKMHCGENISPKSVGHYFDDSTPGVYPDTAAKGLNRLFSLFGPKCPKGNWRVEELSEADRFLREIAFSLGDKFKGGHLNEPFYRTRKFYSKDGVFLSKRKERRSPLIALINAPGKEKGKALHYVTIVDMYSVNNKCRIVYNTWQEQHELPCDKFAEYSRKAKTVGISPYTLIKLN